MISERSGAKAAFSVYISSVENYQENSIVLFDSILINYGSHYNNDTGRFVCPYDGLYLFMLNMWKPFFSSNGICAQIMLDGKPIASVKVQGTSGRFIHGGNSMIVNCLNGQKVWVRVHQDSTVIQGSADIDSTFIGLLLYRYA